MQRLPSSIPLFIAVLIALSISPPVFSDHFNWQYNRTGTPFAVFYNPSLIGNNPGHTIGINMMSDSIGYGLRGAVIVPVGEVKERKISELTLFSNPYHSYRSSRAAISAGGMYNSRDDYQISAGFAAPLWFIQYGASFDLSNRDEHTVGAFNLAFMSNIATADNMLYAGVNNLAVVGRDNAGDFNASIGVAGGRFSHIPYDLLFTCWLGDDGISLMEGTVRVSLDVTPLLTSDGTVGQLPSVALGYTLARDRDGELGHKVFANFGIVFVNKSSTGAVLGSYGLREKGKDEKGAAVFYSSYNPEPPAAVLDRDLSAALSYSDAGDGKVLFSLKAAGPTVSSWVLRIENPRGGSVNTFSGGNVVPSSVLWDGLRADGSAVGEEMVSAKLVLKGAERVVESKTVEIPLK